MEGFIKEYLAYLGQLGYAEQSIEGKHRGYIKEFKQFLDKQHLTEWTRIEVKHLEAYVRYLRKRVNKVIGGKLTEKTVYDQYRSIQLLFDLLIAQGKIERNPSSELQVKAPIRKQRKILVSEKEIEQLYAACGNAKERIILSLNYGCGLRVGELEKLEISDVKLEEGYLIVRKGKGNKRRVVPLSLGVIKDVRKYLREERPKLTAERHYCSTNRSVLLNEVGRSMKEWTINTRLQRLALRTENECLIRKKITSHMMRHSIATHLLHRGLEMHQVREFLGHVLLSTTQLYTHIAKEQVMEL